MNNKGVSGLLASLLILVIIIAIVLAILLLPMGTGYKVKASGGASYNIAFGWSVSFSGVTTEKDKYILATEPGLWFWDTGGIVIEVDLGDYKAEKNIGSVSSWLGGSKPWSVDIRHVEPGYYTGTVYLYEMVGGFFGFGGEKTLRTSCQISFEVVEEV